MKLALFGGSFDPPHIGHDLIIKNSLSLLNIDKLIIMPTFLNPLKSKFMAPPDLRLKWVNDLWGKFDSRIEISDFEISQNSPVFTITSVRMLYKRFDIDKFYLIIGEDNLSNLSSWHKIDELKNMVEFVVFSRDIDNLNYKIPNSILLKKFDKLVKISSTSIRNGLDKSKIPTKIRDEVIKFYGDGLMNERVDKIVKILDDKKAFDIQSLDMRGGDYLTDYVIIANTLTSRHAFSLIDELKMNLKPDEDFLNIESSDDWSVIDLGDIIIHLMSETYRAKYNIEEFLEKLKKPQSEI